MMADDGLSETGLPRSEAGGTNFFYYNESGYSIRLRISFKLCHERICHWDCQWATVGIFASGLLYAFAPWYRRTQTVNKFYIIMCFGLGGGAYKSDRYMVNYERRGRAEMLDAETRRRYDLIYGGKSDEQEEAKKVSAST
ncbi:unnamed protein product [Absidia cylindrospora]